MAGEGDIEKGEVNASVQVLVPRPVEQWERALLRHDSPMPSTCCIFRVPEVLRRQDILAYEPDIVSIGPFHRGTLSRRQDEDDPIFNVPCTLEYIYHDLLLLENQLPWSVLEFFYRLIEEGTPEKDLSVVVVDFFRRSVVYPSIFSYRKAESPGSHRVFTIPPLAIDERTGPMFRNLMAFEQCYHSCKHLITSYAVLMDNLIDTNKDVNFLCEEGIVANWLSAEVATKFFNNLYKDTTVVNFHYKKLCDDVHEYHNNTWNSLYPPGAHLLADHIYSGDLLSSLA
ncbi:hypothetical protein M0R45_013597 [Rubus argutus]|uniref:Uncharacterized protein n=1 Tax=Rubus argutus TaxID=59490 RepID=A0AAW1XIZ2_RUBAR